MKKKINLKVNKKEINFQLPLTFDVSKMVHFKGYEDQKCYIYNDPNTEALRSRCLGIAAIMKVNIGFFEQCDLVVVDDEFMKLPEFARDFFLYHELGHYMNKHLENASSIDTAKWVLKRYLGLIPAMEFEADAFAAGIVGKANAVNALLYLAKNSNAGLISKAEMIRRANRLKK